MGLRDIQIFDQALLAKLAWRILTGPESILARILVGKYCQNKNFLDVEIPHACSHGWKGILHGIDLLKEHLGNAVGNGQTTRVWKDSWISLEDTTRPIGPIPEEHLDLKVADLLTSEMEWNSTRLEEILPAWATKIQCLHPSIKGAEDAFILHPLQSGIYSAKFGYYSKAMQAISQESIISPEGFNWIKDVWTGPYSPKMKIFLWPILQNALPLGENQ